MKTSCFLFDFLFFLWHYKFSTVYGPDEQRMKVEHEVTWHHGEINKKYYAPDYEEEDFYRRKRQLHYIYGGNGLAAVCIIENGETTVYGAYTDFQGSLVALTSHSLLIEKYAYDPWGMRRDPYDWTKPDTREVSQQLSPYLTDRGYTMHEHIPGTDLIDMNGRVYDCTTATFLTCDPYVQDPGNWLNHNPYTYCLNNPLKYTDPSGEFIHLLAGGFLNWAANGFKFNLEGLGYFGVGAFSAGIFSGLAGGIASTFTKNGSFWGGFASNISSISNMPWNDIAGFGRGFVTFGGAGLGGGFFTGFGNSLVGGNGLGSSFVSGLKSGIIGGAVSGVLGGVSMGLYASKYGYNFWDGTIPTGYETLAQTPGIQLVGQDGAANCLEGCIESIENSYGRTYRQNTIREMLYPGSNPETAMMVDRDFAHGYEELMNTTVHFVKPALSNEIKQKAIISYMQKGARVMINHNSHAVVVSEVYNKIFSRLNGTKKIVTMARLMNPARGGYWSTTSLKSLLNGNIFLF